MPTNYIDKIITTDNTEYVISVDLNNVQNADDLKAIEGISGTSGLLKKTASNTWTLDTSDYVTSEDIPEGASAYTGTISAVGTSSSGGSNNGFARGDHVHNITKTTIDTVLGTGSGTEKFYREDGTWAAVASTDEKLKIAAVTSGTTYYPIVATNSTAAATRQYDATGLAYAGTNGTASAVGTAKITLGNSTASGTANNKKGQVVLYGSTAYATTIDPGSPTAARTITLPNKTGTVALTSDIPTISYPVTSVNTKTGAVSLTASDVGAVATSGNETVSGNKTFSGVTSLTAASVYPASQNTIIPAKSDAIIQSPIPKYLWHDVIAFCRAATPTEYTTTDGSTWTSRTLEKRLFAHMNAWGRYEVINSSISGSRWVWHGGGFSYCGIQWIILGICYSATIATFDLKLETTADATAASPTWTTLCEASNVKYNQTPIWIKTSAPSTSDLRLTITRSSGDDSTTVLPLCSIEFLTTRWGDQGKGVEFEYPYNWDGDKNITFLNKVTLNAAPTSDMEAATKKYVDDHSSDTKNTAGSTDTSSKIYLIGATSQAANPQTYSHDTAYVGTDGYLYSNSKKTLVEQYSNNGYVLNITPSVSSSSADFTVQAALDNSGNFYNTLHLGSDGFYISNDIDEKTWFHIDNNGTTPVSISGVKTPQTQYDAVNKKYVDDNIPTKTSDLTNDSGFVTSDTNVTSTAVTAATTYYLTGSTNSSTVTNTLSKHASANIYVTSSSSGTDGYTRLTLGNNTSGLVTGGKAGEIRLYGNLTYYTDIKSDVNQPSANRTLTLPNNSGTIALTSDIPTVPTNISAFTNDSGYITSADVPEGASAYTGTISAVSTTASNGTSNGFARGDHTHNITKTTIDSVLGTGSGTTKYYREDGTWVAPTDTKNTAGSTTTTSKIYLIGATSQAANPQTYSNAKLYYTRSSGLYSEGGNDDNFSIISQSSRKIDLSVSTDNTSHSPSVTVDETGVYIGNTTDTPSAITLNSGFWWSDSDNYVRIKNLIAPTNDLDAATKKYVDDHSSDTKNTAGSTDSSSKLFLIGATTQAANPQTYSHDTAYVGTDGKLYSANKVVLTGGSNAASSVSITPSTTAVYSMTSAGSVTAGTKASFTRGTFSQGTLPTMTWAMDSTDTKKLNITFSQGTLPTHAADSFTANTPTAVTLPGRSSAIKAWTGYTAATAAAQTFTGTTG